MKPRMRPTKPQLDELHKQQKGIQCTYGCHRAKVQNALVRLGLSVKLGRDGLLAANEADVWFCGITTAGLQFLGDERTLPDYAERWRIELMRRARKV